MKASARIITQQVRAKAVQIADLQRVRAEGIPLGIGVTARPTDGRGYYKPIRVTPESPQTLVWLTPGNTIDYTIITNLDWQII